MKCKQQRFHALRAVLIGTAAALAVAAPVRAQPSLPEVNIVVVIPNMSFSAVWVAEQLKYFEAEGVRAKISVAGGGSPCLSAVVGRSAQFCASASDGVLLAKMEGAPLIAVQSINRNMTVSFVVQRSIVEKLRLTRESPLTDRLKVLTQLKTIGATSPGAVGVQIVKFLAKKVGGDPDKFKFVYLDGSDLPSALMRGALDGFAISPPAGEALEAKGNGYVLLALARGEVPELTDFPYQVVTVRPDWAESHPGIVEAVTRAISKAGALFQTDPQKAKAALRAHRFFNTKRLDDAVFDLAFTMVKDAMPGWGNMTEEGWQKVIQFTAGAGVMKDVTKAPSPKAGTLWTNKYVGDRR